MSTKLSFREALERRDDTREEPRAPSGSPVKLNLVNSNIGQPVSVGRYIRSCGTSLPKAHETSVRLAAGDTVAIELYTEDTGKLIADLTDLGVKAHVIAPPQADAKQVRERLGLSQAEVARRFGFELDTVQNWEQGRYRPDPAAQILLSVIEAYPEYVDSVLTKRPLR